MRSLAGGLDRLGVAGDHPGIDPIRFGQDPKRPGKVAHLARIYHRHLIAGVPESVGQLLLVAASGLCDHQRHQIVLEALDQRPEPGRRVGQGKDLALGPEGDIDGVFGNVDAYIYVLAHM